VRLEHLAHSGKVDDALELGLPDCTFDLVQLGDRREIDQRALRCGARDAAVSCAVARFQ
jgi:hypothetical protein